MNLVILTGRLTADPEYSISSTGTNIAKYSLAVDRQVKKDGQATADFLRCTCFGKNADFAAKYLHKGMKIAIEGNLRTGSYEKDGVKHYPPGNLRRRLMSTDSPMFKPMTFRFERRYEHGNGH